MFKWFKNSSNDKSVETPSKTLLETLESQIIRLEEKTGRKIDRKTGQDREVTSSEKPKNSFSRYFDCFSSSRSSWKNQKLDALAQLYVATATRAENNSKIDDSLLVVVSRRSTSDTQLNQLTSFDALKTYKKDLKAILCQGFFSHRTYDALKTYGLTRRARVN